MVDPGTCPGRLIRGPAPGWLLRGSRRLPSRVIGSPRSPLSPLRPGKHPCMRQPPRLVRRTALGLLATWPLGVASRRASAAAPAGVRQGEALAHAEFVDPPGTCRIGLAGSARPPGAGQSMGCTGCPGCLEELPTIRALAALLSDEAIDVILLSHAMNWRGDQSLSARNQPAVPPLAAVGPEVPESVEAAAFRMEADRFALPQSLVFAIEDRAVVRAQEGSLDWMAPDQVRQAQRPAGLPPGGPRGIGSGISSGISSGIRGGISGAVKGQRHGRRQGRHQAASVVSPAGSAAHR